MLRAAEKFKCLKNGKERRIPTKSPSLQVRFIVFMRSMLSNQVLQRFQVINLWQVKFTAWSYVDANDWFTFIEAGNALQANKSQFRSLKTSCRNTDTSLNLSFMIWRRDTPLSFMIIHIHPFHSFIHRSTHWLTHSLIYSLFIQHRTLVGYICRIVISFVK